MFGDVGKCKFVSSSGALRLQGWTRERSALVVVCTEVLVVRGVTTGVVEYFIDLSLGYGARSVRLIKSETLNSDDTGDTVDPKEVPPYNQRRHSVLTTIQIVSTRQMHVGTGVQKSEDASPSTCTVHVSERAKFLDQGPLHDASSTLSTQIGTTKSDARCCRVWQRLADLI